MSTSTTTEALAAKAVEFSEARQRISQQSGTAIAGLMRLDDFTVPDLDKERLRLRLSSLERMRIDSLSPTVIHQKEDETSEAYQMRQLLTLKRDLAGMVFLEKQLRKCLGLINRHLIPASVTAARERLRQSATSL